MSTENGKKPDFTVEGMMARKLRAMGADGLCNTQECCGCSLTELFLCSSGPNECVPAIKTIATESGDCYDIGDEIYVPMNMEGKEEF